MTLLKHLVSHMYLKRAYVFFSLLILGCTNTVQTMCMLPEHASATDCKEGEGAETVKKTPKKKDVSGIKSGVIAQLNKEIYIFLETKLGDSVGYRADSGLTEEEFIRARKEFLALQRRVESGVGSPETTFHTICFAGFYELLSVIVTHERFANSILPILCQCQVIHAVSGCPVFKGTPLMGVCEGYSGFKRTDHEVCHNKRASFINALLMLYRRPCQTDSFGNSALHYLVRYGNFQAIQLMLNAGADPEFVDASGQSALALAHELRLKSAEKNNEASQDIYKRIAKEFEGVVMRRRSPAPSPTISSASAACVEPECDDVKTYSESGEEDSLGEVGLDDITPLLKKTKEKESPKIIVARLPRVTVASDEPVVLRRRPGRPGRGVASRWASIASAIFPSK